FLRRGALSGGNIGTGAAPAPWFVLAFMGVISLNSAVSVPADLSTAAAWASTLLLLSALGAMGLETNIRKVHSMGLRPLLLGAMSWLFIATLGLGLILLLDI